MGVTFPNETPDYRRARAALIEREIALRREMEALATELRALPQGGEVPEDYLFDCIGTAGVPCKVRLSELFRGGDALILYHICSLATSRISGRGRRWARWLRCPWPKGRARRVLRSSTCGKER